MSTMSHQQVAKLRATMDTVCQCDWCQLAESHIAVLAERDAVRLRADRAEAERAAVFAANEKILAEVHAAEAACDALRAALEEARGFIGPHGGFGIERPVVLKIIDAALAAAPSSAPKGNMGRTVVRPPLVIEDDEAAAPSPARERVVQAARAFRHAVTEEAHFGQSADNLVPDLCAAVDELDRRTEP